MSSDALDTSNNFKRSSILFQIRYARKYVCKVKQFET